MKNKPIQYTPEGAACVGCGEVVRKYPFGEGAQQVAMRHHQCPTDQARAQLKEVKAQLEELLHKNDMKLSADWCGGSQTVLTLTHTVRGVEQPMGEELS